VIVAAAHEEVKAVDGVELVWVAELPVEVTRQVQALLTLDTKFWHPEVRYAGIDAEAITNLVVKLLQKEDPTEA
jgi:hypothetical protein